MKKKVKALWLQALRSGEYVQGKHYLRNRNNAFCCLGVLCNLHAQAHPKTAARQKDAEKYIGETAGLPPQVARWAGLNPIEDPLGPKVYIDGVGRSLAGHNDTGASFKEIAAAIEREL